MTPSHTRAAAPPAAVVDPRPHRLPFIVGLDGLRAIAVIAVLLYHSDFEWMGGGFLGVEAFFVISGYLITSLLIAEHQSTGGIAYRTFLARRARRLLPALAFFLLGSVALAAAFARDALETVLREIPAAAGYVYNWFAVVAEQSYFDRFGRPSFLQHLWSLAIEEQFYLVWPIVLILGLRFLPRRRMMLVTLAVAAASSLLMLALYVPLADPSRLYYGTDTRLGGLLIGAALAFAWNPARARSGATRLGISPWATDLAGVLGLAVLAWSFVAVRGDVLGGGWLYRGGFVVVGLATASAVAATAHPESRLGRILSLPVLTYIGVRSYAIYLWHWPVFMVTRPRVDVGLEGMTLLAVRLFITLALAEISYRLVERPVREGTFLSGLGGFLRGPWRGANPSRAVAAVGAFALVAAVLFGVQTQRQATIASGEEGEVQAAVVAVEIPVSTPDGNALPTEPPPESTTSSTTNVPPPTLARAAVVSTTDSPEPAGNKKGKDQEQKQEEGKTAENKKDAKNAAEASKDDKNDGEKKRKNESEEQPVVAAAPVDEADVTTPPPEVEPKAEPAQFIGIGDSVMLGASTALEASGATSVDGQVGRQWWDATPILAEMPRNRLVNNVVVVHLGHNGPMTDEMFDDLMGELPNKSRVVFVNLRLPRRWEKPVNKELANGVKRWDNAVLVDWHGFSNDHPEYFSSDGVHLTPAGGEVYAGLIAEAVSG